MTDKTNMEIFLDYFPAFHIWYKAIATYISQLLIFVFTILFLYWISSTYLTGAILGQLIIVGIGTSPYFYMAIRSEKIRKKYLEKYKELAAQKLWYHFIFYAIPLLYSSMYLPLMLKTDYIPPTIVSYPNHILTQSLLPFYVTIPIFIIILIIGIYIRKPSGGFGVDVDSYIYYIYPERGKLLVSGMYQFIRNPRYLSRFIIVFAFSIIANNILAFIVGFIHIFTFTILMKVEDKELQRRFGDDFVNYKKKVPALLPKYGNWINFAKFIFRKS